MTTIYVVAYGQPAPQGSKDAVGRTKTGRAILVETSRKTLVPWREAVKYAARAAMARHDAEAFPLDGPLVVTMAFTLRKPASAPKRRRTWPDRTPDLSKLARGAEDALVDAGLIADDARIVEYERLAKVFAGEDPMALSSPGVQVWVRRVEAE